MNLGMRALGDWDESDLDMAFDQKEHLPANAVAGGPGEKSDMIVCGTRVYWAVAGQAVRQTVEKNELDRKEDLRIAV